jgi:hypothetical protein
VQAKKWVLYDQHELRKKGVGRGIHQSDVICSTIGWLKDASQTLEYGKNYNGYWTGELFCKQVRENRAVCYIPINHKLLTSQLSKKIIPVFEAAHGPGFQALIMVDHFQGHAAYTMDALLATHMNVKPGGKQARLHDGWFMQDGSKITQPMIYPANHAVFPNQPKGMKAVLEECSLYPTHKKLCGKCKDGCEDPDVVDFCCKRVLENQADFKQQTSFIQEIVEAAGHMCIFLPKFYCELNFIEFFWGTVKQYLQEHCDYSFETLKENMPKALSAVPLATIRQWEHHMIRWMDAYQKGMATQDAQLHVQKFSSTMYKSHCRIPECVAHSFDHPQAIVLP